MVLVDPSNRGRSDRLSISQLANVFCILCVFSIFSVVLSESEQYQERVLFGKPDRTN